MAVRRIHHVQCCKAIWQLLLIGTLLTSCTVAFVEDPAMTRPLKPRVPSSYNLHRGTASGTFNTATAAAAAELVTAAGDELVAAAATTLASCNMSTSTLANVKAKLPKSATFVMGIPGNPGYMSIELNNCQPPSPLCAAANQPFSDGNCIDTSRPIRPGQFYEVAVFSSYAGVSTMKCPGAASSPFRPTPRPSAMAEANYVINTFSYGKFLY